jgi:hypothetical protein
VKAMTVNVLHPHKQNLLEEINGHDT